MFSELCKALMGIVEVTGLIKMEGGHYQKFPGHFQGVVTKFTNMEQPY